MSTESGYIPSAADRGYIEATAAPIEPALLAIESAARPEGIPILDRESGRILAVLAGARRRILEIGTAIGYSTLCLALGAGPAATIVTIDPDRSRTDRARGFWRQAGVADERILVVDRPALEALADPTERALGGPFDLLFVDALKGEYQAYLEALMTRLPPGALVVADNVLWSGRVSGDRPAPAGDASEALHRFNAAVLGDPRFVATILPVGDGLLVATVRG